MTNQKPDQPLSWPAQSVEAAQERAALREPLRRFAATMEGALRKHDADRGAHGWSNDTASQLFVRLLEEVSELAAAIQKYDSTLTQKEAADVANFAMMIADVVHD